MFCFWPCYERYKAIDIRATKPKKLQHNSVRKIKESVFNKRCESYLATPLEYLSSLFIVNVNLGSHSKEEVVIETEMVQAAFNMTGIRGKVLVCIPLNG